VFFFFLAESTFINGNPRNNAEKSPSISIQG